MKHIVKLTIAALLLSIPFTAQANSNYPAGVLLIDDQGFLSGVAALNPNAPGIEVCAGQTNCFKWNNTYYPTQAATEQAIAEAKAKATAHPTQSSEILGTNSDNALVVAPKAYNPSWDPEGICLGASECWVIPDGSVYTSLGSANAAWLQYQLEQTFPTNIYEITAVSGGGAPSFADVSEFNPDAPGADSCLNKFGCYIVDGTYYPTLGDAKDAYIAFNQAALEASYPDTTYEVTGINDDGTAILSEVEFDYSILNADNCLNNGDCYLAEGAYYTTELLAKAILEQAIEQAAIAAAAAAAEYEAYALANYPKNFKKVHYVYSDGNIGVSVQTYDHTVPGAEICLEQQYCYVWNGDYYTDQSHVFNAWVVEQEEAAAAAAYAASIAPPINTYRMTNLADNGSLDVVWIPFNANAEGADICLGVPQCIIVNGTHYPGTGEAVAAWQTWAATFPTTTYTLEGTTEENSEFVEVKYDPHAEGAETCINEDTCIRYKDEFYTSKEAANEAFLQNLEAGFEVDELDIQPHPNNMVEVTGLDNKVLVTTTVDYDPDAPGANVCLSKTNCYIFEGTYYAETTEIFDILNTRARKAKVIETSAANAETRLAQIADTIDSDTFDEVDNFLYQRNEAAGQHRIRLRIDENTYFNDKWSTADISSTQDLIVQLTKDVFVKGFNEGYESGFKEGYEDGYNEGYFDGYNDFLEN